MSVLRDYETSFLSSIKKQVADGRGLTNKQAAYLLKILCAPLEYPLVLVDEGNAGGDVFLLIRDGTLRRQFLEAGFSLRRFKSGGYQPYEVRYDTDKQLRYQQCTSTDGHTSEWFPCDWTVFDDPQWVDREWGISLWRTPSKLVGPTEGWKIAPDQLPIKRPGRHEV